MGEEYGETNPFPFFCDFQDPDLIEAVREGRKKEFAYFGWTEEVPDPFAESTRDSAVLSWDWSDPVRSGLRRLYRDLSKLRRESPPLLDFRHPRVRLLEGSRVLEMIREDRYDKSLTILLQPRPRNHQTRRPWLAVVPIRGRSLRGLRSIRDRDQVEPLGIRHLRSS